MKIIKCKVKFLLQVIGHYLISHFKPGKVFDEVNKILLHEKFCTH